MNSFMAMMNSCRDKAKQTHEGLCTSNPLAGVYAFGPVPESHCFRVNLIGATDAHGFTAVSVSHPPDVGPSMYEIALVGAGGGLVYIDRLGMGDIYRFSSLGELVDGLVRLANNLPVYEDDDEAGNLKYIRAGSDLSIWPHIVHNLNRYHIKTGKNWRSEDLSEDYLLTPIIKFKKGREPSGVPYLYTGIIPDKNLIVDNNFPYQFKNRNRIRVEKMPISQHLLLINLSESIQEFFLEGVLMYLQNIQERGNYQIPENNLNIQNIQPIINNQVPEVQNIQIIQENINNFHGRVNINRRPNQGYYAWYCLFHGDCFLTSTNREPRSRDSRCGVLDVCQYEFLGFLSLRDGINFYTEHGMDLRNYFDDMNDGYTLDMFTNMISCPQRRNSAILY